MDYKSDQPTYINIPFLPKFSVTIFTLFFQGYLYFILDFQMEGMENVFQNSKSFQQVIDDLEKSGLQIIPMSDEDLANEERNYNNALAGGKKN